MERDHRLIGKANLQPSHTVNTRIIEKGIRSKFFAIAIASIAGTLANPVLGVDLEGTSKEWSFDSSLSRSSLQEKATKLKNEGKKIADLETFRIGRTEKVAAVWVDANEDEKWLYRDGMSIATLKKEHAEHTEAGYMINEIEAIRIGANLEFSAVWTKSENQAETLFFWGMDELLFSNRYGEMADRGYRLQDIEIYTGNGRDFYTAIWTAKAPEENVRFYRGLTERVFMDMASKMRELNFRMIDVEGYYMDDKLLFAASWEELEEGQEAEYEMSLLVDVFYQKNAEYTAKGYRLVDFDTYPKSATEMRYAGCWVKQNAVEETQEDKDAFIEAFRISAK